MKSIVFHFVMINCFQVILYYPCFYSYLRDKYRGNESKNKNMMNKYPLFLCLSRYFHFFEFQQNGGVKYEEEQISSIFSFLISDAPASVKCCPMFQVRGFSLAREIRKNFGIIHCRTPCRTLQLPAAAPLSVVSSVRSSSFVGSLCFLSRCVWPLSSCISFMPWRMYHQPRQ